jgi:hypothetical protein
MRQAIPPYQAAPTWLKNGILQARGIDADQTANWQSSLEIIFLRV